MEIVKTEGNKELTYELIIDREGMKKLIDEIIQNCSLMINQKQYIEARDMDEVKKIVKKYQNVANIQREELNDPFDYWRHGDPLPYSFTADILIHPNLVNFLQLFLANNSSNYDNFKERKEINAENTAKREIEELDREINKVSNFETEKKIQMLKRLSEQVKALDKLPKFNLELLSYYYDRAEEYIKLELVQETINYRKKLTPKK